MKDNQEIAKDYTEWHIKTGGHLDSMTMRDHFAALAMQSVIVSKPITNYDTVAYYSYEMADAMLKERAK